MCNALIYMLAYFVVFWLVIYFNEKSGLKKIEFILFKNPYCV